MQPEIRRTDVIGFLTGITQVERFTIDDDLADAQTKMQAKEAYYQSVQNFLIENGIPTLLQATVRVTTAEAALEQAQIDQRELQLHLRQEGARAEYGREGRLGTLRAVLLEVKAEAATAAHSLYSIEQEEERVKELLNSLVVDREKNERLQSSSTILSSVEFSLCPRCLLDITDEMHQRELFDRCSLCNRPLRSTSDALPRALPRLEDIDAQIDETNEILRAISDEHQTLSATLASRRQTEHELSANLDRESSAFVTPAIDQLIELAHRVARAEAEVTRARHLLNQAQALDRIRIELDELRKRHGELEDLSREVRKPRRQRIAVLRGIYDQILREIELPGYRDCAIDSQSLMPLINGNQYKHLGAALKGLAVTAYHLAMLELARREDTFFPRMLVIDSPAVGDLNEESQDKLLQYLDRLQQDSEQPSSATTSDRLPWQIILTTRRILPELEPYVIRQLSAPNRMLLQ